MGLRRGDYGDVFAVDTFATRSQRRHVGHRSYEWFAICAVVAKTPEMIMFMISIVPRSRDKITIDL